MRPEFIALRNELMFEINLLSDALGAEVVGVPCTPPARSKFTRPERYLASAADGKAPPLRRRDPPGMELEKWPLVQAYGLDGVGRDGFFTMTRAVVDASTSSSDACDRAAMFTTALIQSDFIRGRESELKESVRALRRAGETFTSKRAQGLGVTWKVAFGVDLE